MELLENVFDLTSCTQKNFSLHIEQNMPAK